jgi:hypothetical protein
MSLIPFNYTDDAGVCIGTGDVTMHFSRDEIKVFEFLWLHGKTFLGDQVETTHFNESFSLHSPTVPGANLIEEAMFKMAMLFNYWV